MIRVRIEVSAIKCVSPESKKIRTMSGVSAIPIKTTHVVKKVISVIVALKNSRIVCLPSAESDSSR